MKTKTLFKLLAAVAIEVEMKKSDYRPHSWCGCSVIAYISLFGCSGFRLFLSFVNFTVGDSMFFMIGFVLSSETSEHKIPISQPKSFFY